MWRTRRSRGCWRISGLYVGVDLAATGRGGREALVVLYVRLLRCLCYLKNHLARNTVREGSCGAVVECVLIRRAASRAVRNIAEGVGEMWTEWLVAETAVDEEAGMIAPSHPNIHHADRINSDRNASPRHSPHLSTPRKYSNSCSTHDGLKRDDGTPPRNKRTPRTGAPHRAHAHRDHRVHPRCLRPSLPSWAAQLTHTRPCRRPASRRPHVALGAVDHGAPRFQQSAAQSGNRRKDAFREWRTAETSSMLWLHGISE